MSGGASTSCYGTVHASGNQSVFRPQCQTVWSGTSSCSPPGFLYAPFVYLWPLLCWTPVPPQSLVCVGLVFNLDSCLFSYFMFSSMLSALCVLWFPAVGLCRLCDPFPLIVQSPSILSVSPVLHLGSNFYTSYKCSTLVHESGAADVPPLVTLW